MKKLLRPYLMISLCGLVAFAPVSFMLRALKNDIVALEYPINHFISQSIRHGEWPIWFNTWGMGFPLQSNLTWGVFSTPQLFFSAVFNYDIYALHIEFMFFILLAGWGMYYLLQRFFIKDEKLAILLSVAYMLSGFMIGSTQWLLYITAAAFVPLLLASLLSLFEKPGWWRSVQVAVIYTMMFTSVYAAFNIITTYCIIFFVIIHFLMQKDKAHRLRQVRFVFISAVTIGVLCLPVLWFTYELLQHMDRGSGLAAGTEFSDSNYLHPAALRSLLLPFSSVKMHYDNTEGTMLDSYTGLFIVLILPVLIGKSIQEKNKKALAMLALSLFFLLVSFGEKAGLRPLLNILPGFSYFRNPSLFRFYFIFSLFLFLALSIREMRIADLMNNKWIRFTAFAFMLICAGILVSHASDMNMKFNSIEQFVKGMQENQALVISAVIQLTILLLLLLLLWKKQWRLSFFLLAGEMVLNTVLCTPFFSVGSYTPAEVNSILKIKEGFPPQSTSPSEVSAVFTDNKNNTWQNVNIFSKEVSGQSSYRGPLHLKDAEVAIPGKKLVFCLDDSLAEIEILIQRPGHVRAKVVCSKLYSTIRLQQNFFGRGWKVCVNGTYEPFTPTGGITVGLVKRENIVDFRYERNDIVYFAIFLHLIIIGFILFRLIRFSRSFSPSLPS